MSEEKTVGSMDTVPVIWLKYEEIVLDAWSSIDEVRSDTSPEVGKTELVKDSTSLARDENTVGSTEVSSVI